MLSDTYTVGLDQVRDKLRTVESVREALAGSEPLAEHTFPVGSNVMFRLDQDLDDSEARPWPQHFESETVDAWVRTAPATAGGTEYQLTKKAVLEFGAACGIPRDHQQKIPAHLLAAEINWWFTEGFGDRAFKLLTQGGNTVLGMCRATISPFSNVRMLETTLAGIEKFYGAGEVLADYKFHHDLELTSLRLIVPGQTRVITGTREANDTWSTGIRFRNSLIGLKPPEMSGYLFRYWCTNGSYDTLSTVTAPRRQIASEEEAMAWAAESVNAVLGGLEGALDSVQALTTVPVEGSASLVLHDIFARNNVPQRERRRVLEGMADLGGDLTMYDIQNAITRAANLEGLSDRTVDNLLSAGGHVLHSVGSAACDRCRRPLPEGYSLPAVIEGEVVAEANGAEVA